MVGCCRLLEVRSWSGNDVPVNLYQMNVILCPDQKGQSPKAQLSPSKVLALTKGRESSAGSSFRARFPHSAQLSSLREPGTQPRLALSLLGLRKWETPSITDCSPGRRPLLVGRRDRDETWVMANGGP